MQVGIPPTCVAKKESHIAHEARLSFIHGLSLALVSVVGFVSFACILVYVFSGRYFDLEFLVSVLITLLAFIALILAWNIFVHIHTLYRKPNQSTP